MPPEKLPKAKRKQIERKAAVRRLLPGGSTNLSAGFLRGIQEARRVAGPGGATLLLVSDGHANVGVTEPDAGSETFRIRTRAERIDGG